MQQNFSIDIMLNESFFVGWQYACGNTFHLAEYLKQTFNGQAGELFICSFRLKKNHQLVNKKRDMKTKLIWKDYIENVNKF